MKRSLDPLVKLVVKEKKCLVQGQEVKAGEIVCVIVNKLKKISLTRNYYTLVNDDDYKIFSKERWQANVKDRRNITKVTASRVKAINGKPTTLYLHREIMKAPKGMYVDHINGDTLDNRRRNLRLCSNSENMRNRGKNTNNTSGYKGVSFSKERNMWESKIIHQYKTYHLGYFNTKEKAARAYNRGAKKYHGKFAMKNVVKWFVS